MSPEVTQENERILALVEGNGGSYVWEREIFAVTLMSVAIADDQAASLSGLTGVQQIALDASRVSFATLQKIARIHDLRSLVLSGITLSKEQRLLLERCGPKVQVVDKDA